MTPTNIERASWAKAAIHGYSLAKEARRNYDVIDDIASDLFTDMLHLFAALGIDPEHMIQRARTHFEEECAEEAEDTA